ncbi:hypothetical protein F2Q68_00022054 [Brassica cretica]|uniref:Fe2OG dioxygenase domain-containing protein n=1 Tax=Brassica cretica TaxID=69181 RepID=A0A8S9FRP6_BRACR|nr:hypothetical protein F2Q68_00022054 [Brassica cretica]
MCRVLIEEYGRHITRIAVSLFEAIAQALNLELSGDQRSELLSESTGLIRVYRYPQSSSVEAEGEALGMEVHTDTQALNLELSGDQRSELLSESTGLIRVYRYPQSSSVEAEGEALGMEVHTDSSVISILKEDETGGLEIMKGEEWLRVKPVADTLIINLGDMMQDEYKGVKHRVKKKDRTRERHSADVQSLGAKVSLH